MSEEDKVDKVAVFELRSEEEREAFDEWMATVLPVEADWEFRNEVQNHTDPEDLVMVRDNHVHIFQRKVLGDVPDTKEEDDSHLRMQCLMVMEGDVDRARAAYDWVTGKN